MNETVRAQFDRVAGEYDAQRKQLIPCFDDFYGIAASLVDIPKETPSILDLGAGTGLFTAFVKAVYPKGEFTLVDFSESMLDGARKRFGNERMTYIAGDYAETELGGPYCAVISSLSIHHLTHEGKRALFRRVYGLLKKGGIFVNADQARGGTEELEAYNLRLWEEAVRRSGLSEEALEASKERRRSDINATMADQLQWLSQAGFEHVDCMYKNLGFAVFYARK